MTLELTANEIRVIGVLIEKELATPDYYPLTVAALVSGCNQKTSRDPVMNLSLGDVQDVLDKLTGDRLVRERNPAGGRVSKYAHRLGDSLGLSFGFNRAQLAILAVLLLRGRQTPGELKARSERLRGAGVGENVDGVLSSLVSHDRGPWVCELAREPGRREARWTHLLGTSTGVVEDGPRGDPSTLGAVALGPTFRAPADAGRVRSQPGPAPGSQPASQWGTPDGSGSGSG